MAFLTLAVADEQRRLAEHSVLIRNPLFRAGSFVRCNRGSVKSFYVVAVAWGRQVLRLGLENVRVTVA